MSRPITRSLFTYLISSFSLFAVSGQGAVLAQIVPDKSTATQVNGNTIVPVGSGTVNGGNLFHSFDKFNVPNSGVVFGTGNSSVDGSKINNVINRVTGDTPSQILGTIESRSTFPNANLFLLNPNGVVFGKDARLDIGGSFNVSTGTSLGFASDRKFSVDKAALDFPSGNPQNIQFAVSQPAAIINQGNLSVDAGKSISFTSGAIVNSGSLTAPSGNVALTSVAGGSVVDLRSPDLVLGLSVVTNVVPTDWNGSITTLPKLAELLTGKAAQGDRVVVKPDGSLAIVATPAFSDVPVTYGTTVVSGNINVSSVNTDGGKVGIFGNQVGLVNSFIDASGNTGGGTVLIGGDFQGKGTLPNALQNYVDSRSQIFANGLLTGDGGKIIIWADRTTQFLGTILSKGGSLSGNGGFVEVSGKENLLYRGNVDTSASNGNFGTLLLDPTNITIVATGAADNIQLSAGVPNAGDPAFAIFFNDVSTSNFTIENSFLNSASSNIILQARNDINVNAPVNVTTANISFTAQAGNNINVNESIQTNNGNISLLANNGATATDTGSVNLTTLATIALSTNGGNITISGVNVNATNTITTSPFSTGNNAGNVTIQAGGDISLTPTAGNAAIEAFVGAGNTGNGGTVSITSSNGKVITGAINTSADFGNAGNVTVESFGDITTTGNFTVGTTIFAINSFSTSTGNGGNVSLKSDNGAIDVSSGVVSTSTKTGTAGSIDFNASGNITTGAGSTSNSGVESLVFFGGSGTPNTISFISESGAINSSLGNINSGGSDITFKADGNITTAGLFSRAVNGGTIELESKSGAIDTTAGDLTTTTTSTGTGGSITLRANNNITTRGVFATGDNGEISITSDNGSIDTSKDIPTSIGSNNSITLQADQNIKAANIIATGDKTSISIASAKGTVDTILGFIQGGILSTQTGDGGNIKIEAAGDILTGPINAPNLSSSFSGNAGSVFLTSSNGKVQFAGISARRNGGGGDGGNITVQAQDDIISTGVVSFGNISLSTYGTSKAGDIKLTSDAGKIDVSSGAIGGFDSSFQSFIPNGNITLKSALDIILGDINGATAFGAGSISLTTTGIGAKIATGNISVNTQSIDPGRVTLTASGDITTKDINTSSLFADGNSISLTSRSGAVTTGNLNASGRNNGANIIVDAQTQINVGQVNSQSSVGKGGNVILDPLGNVIFTSINATGGSGGGNIRIISTGGNVLGTGVVTFSTADPCVGSTICTNGTGTVFIQHGNITLFNPSTFIVGGATTIGTAGTINTNGSVLTSTGIPNGLGLFTQGNISITPGAGIITPTPTSTDTTTIPKIPIVTVSTTSVVQTARTPAVDISNINNQKAGEYLALGRLDDALNEMENGKISEFENYFRETLTPQSKNLEQIQQELEDISQRSGSVTTIVYPLILSDRLELLIIPPKGKSKPFREFVAEAKESEITPVIQDFVSNIRDVGSQDYLEQSQKLYDWLVRPYSDRLKTINNSKPDTQINPKQNAKPNAEDKLIPYNGEVPKEKLPPTLVFVMDGGLRVIPVAALHDGKQYLIEKYALANLPYLRANSLESRDRRLNNILAMGLTESVQGLSALPSVKLEVSTISNILKGNSYLDKEFTVDNLQEKRRQGKFAVIHLATHAKFVSNNSNNSFIQFWNERLTLNRIPSLHFDSPLIEMLTLSACQTAVGQNLGLAGLSINSGVKSVLASLWEVSDSGTAPLMIQFYKRFPEDITKAIALQRAQIDLLKGNVTIKDGKIIVIPTLPASSLAQGESNNINLEHPFFWSSFILIGNWL